MKQKKCRKLDNILKNEKATLLTLHSFFLFQFLMFWSLFVFVKNQKREHVKDTIIISKLRLAVSSSDSSNQVYFSMNFKHKITKIS